MMHIRKIAPATMALVLAVGLAACGNTQEEKAASGGLGGAAAGAVVGGPVGAVVGAGVGAAGGAYGDEAVDAIDKNQTASRDATGSDGMETQSAMQTTNKAEIRDAQITLKHMGLYEDQVDGIYGPNTRQAVAEFQSRQGLPRSGTLDRRTMQALDQQTAQQIGD